MSDTEYTPTIEVIRHALAYPRERLGEPRPISNAQFDRALAAHDREVAAKAWDEGLDAGRDRWMDHREFGDPPVNPYSALVSEPSTPEGETP